MKPMPVDVLSAIRGQADTVDLRRVSDETLSLWAYNAVVLAFRKLPPEKRDRLTQQILSIGGLAPRP